MLIALVRREVLPQEYSSSILPSCPHRSRAVKRRHLLMIAAMPQNRITPSRRASISHYLLRPLPTQMMNFWKNSCQSATYNGHCRHRPHRTQMMNSWKNSCQSATYNGHCRHHGNIPTKEHGCQQHRRRGLGRRPLLLALVIKGPRALWGYSPRQGRRRLKPSLAFFVKMTL